jgi:hypothetical protein
MDIRLLRFDLIYGPEPSPADEKRKADHHGAPARD